MSQCGRGARQKSASPTSRCCSRPAPLNFSCKKPPVDRPRQLHQRVVHVDDLIEPRTKQILLAALPPFPWPHRTLRSSPRPAENHGFRFEGIPNMNLQENRRQSPNFGKSNCRNSDDSHYQPIASELFHGRLASGFVEIECYIGLHSGPAQPLPFAGGPAARLSDCCPTGDVAGHNHNRWCCPGAMAAPRLAFTSASRRPW
jgi:hypothetical protein